MPEARRVLYVDIDGTVRRSPAELGRPILSAADVEVYPEVPPLLHLYHAAGWRIVGLHQAGELSLGTMTWDQLNDTMRATYEACDRLFSRIAVCQHHPDAEDPEFAVCWCRRPLIGLIIETALEFGARFDEMWPPHLGLLVGDEPEDEDYAYNANLPFRWADLWRSEGFFDPRA